jgi:hypothetical protein
MFESIDRISNELNEIKSERRQISNSIAHHPKETNPIDMLQPFWENMKEYWDSNLKFEDLSIIDNVI